MPDRLAKTFCWIGLHKYVATTHSVECGRCGKQYVPDIQESRQRRYLGSQFSVATRLRSKSNP